VRKRTLRSTAPVALKLHVLQFSGALRSIGGLVRAGQPLGEDRRLGQRAHKLERDIQMQEHLLRMHGANVMQPNREIEAMERHRQLQRVDRAPPEATAVGRPAAGSGSTWLGTSVPSSSQLDVGSEKQRKALQQQQFREDLDMQMREKERREMSAASLGYGLGMPTREERDLRAAHRATHEESMRQQMQNPPAAVRVRPPQQLGFAHDPQVRVQSQWVGQRRVAASKSTVAADLSVRTALLW
jgi:hypothetical protein